MKYKINYIDKDGQRQEEIISGIKKSDLIKSFRDNNLKIIDIKEIKDLKKLNISKNKIKNKRLNIFLKELSILLSSGFDSKTAIIILKNQEKDSKLKDIYGLIENSLNHGYTLSQSIEIANIFPPLVINVIEAGEESSNLSESLDILSDYYKREEKLSQNVKNSLYYPVILLIVTFIIVSIVVTYIIPKYLELYNAFEIDTLPSLTTFVINSSNFISRYGFLVIVALILVIYIIKNITSNESKLKLSRFSLKIPFIGGFLINNDIQRFSGIFRIMIKSGIETIKALEYSSNSMKNNYLKDRFLNTRNEILNGNSLFESFSKIEETPSMFLNLVNVGEFSSDLEGSMATSYEYFSNLVEEDGKKIMSIFEPLIIILVSLVVGTVVIAIALPTFNLVDVI